MGLRAKKAGDKPPPYGNTFGVNFAFCICVSIAFCILNFALILWGIPK